MSIQIQGSVAVASDLRITDICAKSAAFTALGG